PDFVAGQPPPCSLDREDATKPRWVPAAGHARATLPPQAQGLPFKQMGAVFQRGDNARFGRNGRIARDEARFQLLVVLARAEAIAEDCTGPLARHADLERRVPVFVIALDARDFHGQHAPLAGLAVQKAHSSGQWSVVSGQQMTGPPTTNHW